MAVNVRSHSPSLVVEVVVPEDGSVDGVLLARGSTLGGWTRHVLDARLRYVHNHYDTTRQVIEATEQFAAGSHLLEYDIVKVDGIGGAGVLHSDAEELARGVVDPSRRRAFVEWGASLTCGYEWVRQRAT